MSSTAGPGPEARSVLIVDDDEAVLRAYTRLLHQGGYDVVPASRVAEARALLEGGQIGVLVTDVILPDGSGFELLEVARRQSRPVPVVLMTGAADVSTVATAFAAGAVRYLRKPLSGVELLDAVGSVWPNGKRAQPAAPAPPRSAVPLADQERWLVAALDRLRPQLAPICSWSRSRLVAVQATAITEEPPLSAGDDPFLVAERVNCVADAGRRVRDALARRIAALPTELDTYVELHAGELADPELYADGSPLAEQASRIVLAIDERAVDTDRDQAAHRLSLLRALGFRIAIDVDADRASLAVLAALRPDVIRLDPALLRGGKEEIARLVRRSLYNLAAQLGVPVVALGVASSNDLGHVLDAGGDLVAGELLGPAGAGDPTVDFVRLRRQAGGRRHPQTTNRGGLFGASFGGLPPNRGTVARTLVHDASTSLEAIESAFTDLLDDDAIAEPGPRERASQARRQLSECRTVIAALSDVIDSES